MPPLPSPAADLPVATWPTRSLYVHVPFCRHRCGYCDFTLVAGRDGLIGRYLAAIEAELRSRPPAAPLETLYLGGGTPTHLPLRDLRQLTAAIVERFPLAPQAEFTVEANPLDLTEDYVAGLVEQGVNRISLGVQSFRAEELTLLERDHRPAEAEAIIRRVREQIPNLSMDLMFALPGQTAADWQTSLQTAIDLGVPHVSTYCLTIEKGTAFWSRQQGGTLVPAAETVEEELYLQTIDSLTGAGWEQYEISSFARGGARSRHNQVYWSGLPFEAVGPGAARFLHGRRETNHRGVLGWLRKVAQGESPVVDVDELPPRDRARELLVLGLRQCDGVSLEEFLTRTGLTPIELTGGVATKLVDSGWLTISASRWQLTREGGLLADTIAAEILQAEPLTAGQDGQR